jgi:hypothetical protein
MSHQAMTAWRSRCRPAAGPSRLALRAPGSAGLRPGPACDGPALLLPSGMASRERDRSCCDSGGGRSVAPRAHRPFFWPRSHVRLRSWLALANHDDGISRPLMRRPTISTTMRDRRPVALAGRRPDDPTTWTVKLARRRSGDRGRDRGLRDHGLQKRTASYPRRRLKRKNGGFWRAQFCTEVARPKGFEPPTPRS